MNITSVSIFKEVTTIGFVLYNYNDLYYQFELSRIDLRVKNSLYVKITNEVCDSITFGNRLFVLRNGYLH